jgi:hypothetical protein
LRTKYLFCQKAMAEGLGGGDKVIPAGGQGERPPNSLLPAIRFRDWLAWAYRYAVVLGVEKQFVEKRQIQVYIQPSGNPPREQPTSGYPGKSGGFRQDRR